MSGGTAAVSLALTAVSTAKAMAAPAQQQRQQQNAMNAQAKYQAETLEQEKALKHELAQGELAKGEAERTRQQREAMRRHGEAVAGMGASGLTLDSGTNLSLLGESLKAEGIDYVTTQSLPSSSVVTVNMQLGADPDAAPPTRPCSSRRTERPSASR